MIILHTFGPAFGLPDPSPFVTKADLLLQMAGQEYQRKISDLRRAPKGKLPFIDDAGLILADSTFIRWHLEKKYSFDFDAGLNAEQRGVAWAVEKMLEDHLYWAGMHARWTDDENFARGPAIFFKKVPWLLRAAVTRMVRRQIASNMRAHGMGRHSRQDIVALASADLAAVAAILGEKAYLMGDQPCAADAAVFAFVASAMCRHFETPLRTAAEGHANLVAYIARLGQQYYPEYRW